MNNDKKIKAVIFDMDGVLVNTEPLHYRVWYEVFKKHGLLIDYEGYKGCIGCTHKFLMDLILKNYGADFRDNQDIIKEMYELKKITVEEEGYPKIPGTLEMLDKLRDAGYKMAIATSSPKAFINVAMDSIGANNGYFSLYNSAENVKRSKPAPDIYLDTLLKLGLEADECVVVEDSENGSIAATSAGIKCIGFINPDSGNQDLSRACMTIDNMSQLTPELIESL